MNLGIIDSAEMGKNFRLAQKVVDSFRELKYLLKDKPKYQYAVEQLAQDLKELVEEVL